MASPLEVIVKGRHLHLLRSHQEGDPHSRGENLRVLEASKPPLTTSLSTPTLTSFSPSNPLSLAPKGKDKKAKGGFMPP